MYEDQLHSILRLGNSDNYAELINSKSVYQQYSVAPAFHPRGTNKGLSPAFLLRFISKANQ